MRLWLVLLPLTAASGLFGQTDEGFPDITPELRGGVMYPASIEGALRRHGYALERESLLRGLRDTNPQVRSMAADELAKMRETEAAPAIQEALSRETVIGTRVLMANALAELGVEAGTTELHAICEPSSTHFHARLVAAMDLLDRGDATCGDQVIEIVRTIGGFRLPTSAALVGFGLSVIQRAEPVFRPRAADVRDLAATLLRDSRYEVRMAASNTLGRFGDAASITLLQEAAAEETSDVARTRILANIRILQDKLRAPANGKQ